MGSSTNNNMVTELHSGHRRIASLLRRRRRSAASALGFTLGVVGILAFAAVTPADAKAEVSLDQCANLDAVCDAAHPAQWQNGNLTHNDSLYYEGASVPYRAVLSDLTIGATYAVTIEWDTTQSGKHALDYLTSFDRSVPGADPCAGYTCGTSAQLAIPADPNVTAAGVTEVANRFFTAYGATFPVGGATVENSGNLCGTSTCLIAANPSAHVRTGTYSGTSQTSITVHVTAASDRIILAWGGHIAARADWGMTASAVSISGSPYHMRLIDLACSNSTNCGAGNQDRALSNLAVVYPASLTIVKEASVEGSTEFSFTGAPSPLTDFSLIDNGTTANTRSFQNITDFRTYTVNEATGDNFRLSSTECTVVAQNAGGWSSTATGVSIDLREGEIATCTFRNTMRGTGSINLQKTADPTSYDEVGDVITYTYVITNDGDLPIGPTQFTITDDKVDGSSTFNCGPADQTLAVGATVTCTATYTIVAADLDSETDTVTNAATASGGGYTSPQRTTTVNPVFAPPTTTTTSTTSTTTTTTTTSTSTTSTTIAGTTTTAAATTTLAPTTTAAATTTVAPTTTAAPATTIASTTTLAPATTVAPTTTAAPEFQALLTPSTTVPAESDFLVLFPDELPNTGGRFNLGFLVAAFALLAIGSLIGFLNLRSTPAKGNNRKGKD